MSGDSFIVIPAHNRRAVTLATLAHLQQLGVTVWAQLIVVDDGSSDGTADAIAAAHPRVLVLKGDGNLWWSGAIALGMRAAMEREAALIFWLNDDCEPQSGTLERMRDHSAASGEIAVAQTFSAGGGCYTGWRKTWRGLAPLRVAADATEECDAFNGNCVAIPRAVVAAIGTVDAAHLPQVFADTDYGLRARAAGFHARVLGDAACDNQFEDNPEADSWLFGARTTRERWRAVWSVKSYHYVPAYWTYCTRHWGLRGVALFAFPYVKLLLYSALRAVLPRRILIALFGRRSLEWRKQQPRP